MGMGKSSTASPGLELLMGLLVPSFTQKERRALVEMAAVGAVMASFFLFLTKPSLANRAVLRWTYGLIVIVFALTVSPHTYRGIFTTFGLHLPGLFSSISMKMLARCIHPRRLYRPTLWGYALQANQELFCTASTRKPHSEGGGSKSESDGKEGSKADASNSSKGGQKQTGSGQDKQRQASASVPEGSTKDSNVASTDAGGGYSPNSGSGDESRAGKEEPPALPECISTWRNTLRTSFHHATKAFLCYLTYDFLLHTLNHDPSLCAAAGSCESGGRSKHHSIKANEWGHAEHSPVGPGVHLAAAAVFGAVLYLNFEIAYNAAMSVVCIVLPAGYAAMPRNLFNKPWLSCSPRDLWSHRWHQLYRADFKALGYDTTRAALKHLLGQESSDSKAPSGSNSSSSAAHDTTNTSAPSGKAQSGSSNSKAQQSGEDEKPPLSPLATFALKSLPVLAVFIVSGVVHEYMNWAAFGVASGHQFLFFFVHGILVVLEGIADALLPKWRDTMPLTVRRSCMVLLVLLPTAELFMTPWLNAGYAAYFWHPIHVTKTVQQWLRK